MDLIARRKEVFSFYQKFIDPRFCITVPVTLPDFRPWCREKNISSFQFFIWHLAGASLDVPNLTLRYDSNGMYVIDELVVSYTVLDAYKNVNFVTLGFDSDLETFVKHSEAEKEQVERSVSIQVEDTSKQNYFFCSALPWFDISAIQNAFSHRDSAQIPTVVFGKFKPIGSDQIVVNISFQSHHGLADGYHAHLYFETLRENVSRAITA